jgi:Uma2 family endonuclease
MTPATGSTIYTLEEYIQLDETSDIRHEFINGQLYDMSGNSDVHNEMVGNLYFLLRKLLTGTKNKIYFEQVKVKIQGEDYYTYPDVFVTRHPEDLQNKYIKQFPVLIIEVLSDSTRKYDTVDKFIQYQKIETLEYYLLAEPEFMYINCFSKDDKGEWQSAIYNKPEDFVPLKILEVDLPLQGIYNSH